MAITFLQQQSTRVNSATSVTVTISAGAGTFLVVGVMPSGGSASVPISSVTDSNGSNTWHYPTTYPSTNPPANNDGGGDGLAICWCSLTSSVTSVTVNVPSSCAALTAIVSQFSGVSATSSFVSGADQTGSSTPTLSITAGNLAVGSADTSNATAITGMTTILVTRGNLVGYVVPGSTSNQSMSWTPSQTGATGIAQFLAAATVVTGTASFTEAESFTANAGIGATASFIENEMFTAVSGANPHINFSAVYPDQNDPNGIPLIHGLTSYKYNSTTITTYDHWSSTQDGSFNSGPYNTASDTNLYRGAAGVWYTDGSLNVNKNLEVGGEGGLGDNGSGEIQLANAGTVPTTNPTAGVDIYAASGTSTPVKFRDPSGNVRSMADGFARLTSNSGNVTGTAQTTITGLVLAIEASAVYTMESFVIIKSTASTAQTATYSWTGPTGATMQWGDTNTTSDYVATIGGIGGNGDVNLDGVNHLLILKGLLIVSTTAGNLQFTAGCSGASGATYNVLAGSHVRLTRVA